MTRARDGRLTPFAAGLGTLVAIAAGVWLAFGGALPFGSSGYRLEAVFARDANVSPGIPVRIAGVQVGEVTGVAALAEGSDASVVTMRIEDSGLPIHEDAEARLRPRIFLEGNFFVDLRPGSPSAPTVASGHTIPITRTVAPVQLDQVLSSLQSDTRADLATLLRGYGRSVGGAPARTPGEDRDTRGETAGESLNDSLDDSPTALRTAAVLNEALRGTEPADVSELVADQRRVFGALAARDRELGQLVGNFDTTMSALAARQGELRRTIELLPRVLGRADSALGTLNRALPPTRRFAREILPGVRETAPAIDAAFPWIAQARPLVSSAELGGLTRALSPATRDTAAALAGAPALVHNLDRLNRCLVEIVLPAGDVVIEDPPHTTGVPNYRELLQSIVGAVSATQNFDGNGPYTRLQPGGGAYPIQTSPLPDVGPLFGNATRPPLGTRPAYPGGKPPLRRDVACHANQPPDLNGAATGAGP